MKTMQDESELEVRRHTHREKERERLKGMNAKSAQVFSPSLC